MNLEEKLSLFRHEPAARVLASLHRQNAYQAPRIVLRMLPQLHRFLMGRALDWSRLEHRLSSEPLSVDANSGLFLYMLALARGSKHIVEFGSSTGVSTIYLALAARETGGTVIATEFVADKANRARANLRAAGVAEYVDFRQGDALETLRDVPSGVDFFHNDGFPRFVLPVLQLLAPKMNLGAVTLCGNAALFPADHSAYVGWVRDPRNGFISAPLPMQVGGEVSVRAADSGHRSHVPAR